ncbi:putative methylesterase 11, chloroplastic isoform X2 [Malania oleifera]|uniref:putative methylesterase 11, chloroplastic isoform X2 n=1 Tax=Malania oleifera TaxID=397392 RepID=UPI0025AE807D|nr:putative methylesterase 11, chloroplastic isoform X2 [Malania oleifera]
MGNLCACFSPKKVKKKPSKRFSNPPAAAGSSSRWPRVRSSRKDKLDDALIQEQALAAAILFQRHQHNGSLPFDRSASLRYPAPAVSKKHSLPRSSSSRARSLTDPLLQPHQLVNQVILVGHDFGGTCISYAMELFPFKISKAVFIAAAMLSNEQSTLDMFSQQAGSNDLMRQAQLFLYANGNDHPPTAIDLDKSLLRDLLFNQSPSKDVALASVSMRPVPFAPVLEKLALSDINYGSIRRFYIETMEDNAIPIALQESMVNAKPPEQVFRLKGADHSPFFSKPQALHKQLVEISKLPST